MIHPFAGSNGIGERVVPVPIRCSKCRPLTKSRTCQARFRSCLVIASEAKPSAAISFDILDCSPMKTQQFFVYIMTNKGNAVLYTGITNNLRRRVYEHKEKLIEGFTKRYNVVKLVYYEAFGDCLSAIQREKQIKAGSRKKKEALINSVNREWRDLYEGL
jgi:putative endonuclease